MSWRQILTSISGGAIIASVFMARILQNTHERTPRNQADEAQQQRLADEAIHNAYNAINGNDLSLLVPAIFPAARVLLFTATNATPQHHHHPQSPLSAFDLNAFFHLETPAAQVAPEAPHPLRDRLEAAGFDLDTLPDEFIDSITKELMEDPVIAVTEINVNGVGQRTEHIYDRSSYERFNGNCPTNRQPFIEVRDNVELRGQIIAFVEQQAQAQQAINAPLAIEEPVTRVSCGKRLGPSR